MASSSSSSSSTSSIQKRFKYHVFLSFRGEDVRYNFVDHLYDALKKENILTYKDDEEMEKGGIIKDELWKAIEESNFFIIVFSKNYASSSWCLNELVKIMECREISDQRTTYPIFYHVDPSEVRKQSGAFGEVFAKYIEEEEKWREALKTAGNTAGFVLKNNQQETKFIKEIVQAISRKLESTNVYIDKNIVCKDPRIEKVLPSLEIGVDNIVRMIGIWGMGGVGKTTLARIIFDTISTEFECKIFVENVRVRSEKYGLEILQNQILSEVLDDKFIQVTGVGSGKRKIRSKLQGRKVLIVLDDVDHITQLEALAGETDWFKPGSRIIITTREKSVLRKHGVIQINDVDPLSEEDAICLFSRYAFEKDIPPQEYKMLSRKAVHYADGLPLMIIALGRLLRGLGEDEWKDKLKSLENEPLEEMDILKLSYYSLREREREMFLDVACFLHSRHKSDVIRILQSCGFNAISGLKSLEEKALITISDDEYLSMHDLIQKMGRNIVRGTHHRDPEKHSHLWDIREIENILAEGLGTNATRAIAVDSQVKLCSVIVTEGFVNMKKLRFLHVSETENDNSCSDGSTDHVSQNLPNELQYMSWGFYPHRFLPTTFRANNLVALEMSDCRISRLWERKGNQDLCMLKFLDLSFSERLKSLDLEPAPSLEKLNLKLCSELEELYTPNGDKLVFLNLEGCVKIKSLVFIKQLEKLQVLHLTSLDLKEFPDIIPDPEHHHNHLRELQFRDNPIEELPSSIANLQNLESLDLHSCKNLRSLPKSICCLRQLKVLTLKHCILKELPEDMGRLVNLEELYLSHTDVKHLPDSICNLKQLKTLNLSTCRNLEKLPGDINRLICLEKLILKKCSRLRDIPDSIYRLTSLKYLNLLKCGRLKKLPMGLENSGCLAELNIQGTGIILQQSISRLPGLKIIRQDMSVLKRTREYATGKIKSSSSTRNQS